MKNNKIVGKQSISFEHPPVITGFSSVAGKKEGEGPLGSFFDVVEEDPFFGGDNWEDAESRMQKMAAELAIKKAKLKPVDVRYLIAGDLLGQLIATSFGIMDLDIPLFGVYGACSTMGESISIGSMIVDGGYAKNVVALTSSHNASAEKQFRFPLEYGNQRPLAATWTVTGSGAVVISQNTSNNSENSEKSSGGNEKKEPVIEIKGITTGKITDYGVKDSMNMGACMAPAAADVIYQNLQDFKLSPAYYDKIITGDLGYVGQRILIDLLLEKGYDISVNHMDCGIEIYDKETQDTHAGGSGCGCSAITLNGYIMDKLLKREWKRVLFVPTGALLSTVSFNEGNSVPGIAHGVMIEGR
ncbi:stage V sporulation protein AD [Anaeromicropila populeti]|uniref:Stage V sporulation protein AD n=1 Tax=Anaeromicropila populeti TaxID=37658 RepID=A0A1I6JQU8_9FIRM|nr:stage V sporulation protein AD [Anaeromicropila populeti]SFR81308.1 stage V sporulation protein AD [Anaeromicropila populeti]